ncbi:hypothetical protein B0T10DRAFT_496924 [Thelonectria olida]|uniref:Uncharacterized protein n=1 Tax=Thelonectria olida TaxID=1576542 RepID=A0A9P9AJL8_9HYPO|nr:hypothetical protein B0T10DRAFT_496924 [Thelonectria olida]
MMTALLLSNLESLAGGPLRLLAESTVSFAPIKTTTLASAARAGCRPRLIFLHPGGRIEGISLYKVAARRPFCRRTA